MELKPEMFKKMLPLPVTVITTLDANGIVNAAPYGCVMPILRLNDLIAIASAPSTMRHTLQYIRDNKEFVVNIIGRPKFKESMQTARNYPAGTDELAESGLEALPSKTVKPPRIKDAIGWIEATLTEELLREKYSLVIGRVLHSEINDMYIKDGKLTEMPAILLQPEYRVVGEKVIGNAEETMKLFIPQSQAKPST
jgi:flavin reductase (DIM6/NTAB) family NADH-FMN oxidoreductase RutF